MAGKTDTSWNERKAEQLAQELRQADRVLVGIGYGFASAAGLETIPLDQRLKPERYWDFWMPYIRKYRLSKEAPALYEQLGQLLKDKDYFIIDGNADGMIYKSGLDLQRIYKAQGDMARLQCSRNCENQTWVGKKQFDAYAAGEKPDMACPHCGAPLVMNVYSKAMDGKLFCMDPYREKNDAWFRFINREPDKRLAILELGCGYTMPELIRFPFEQIVMNHKNAVLLRVNTQHPLCVEENAAKALCIGENIAVVLPEVLKKMES